MYGWEFPPNNAGGLGTACHGLTKGLVEQGTDVTFVLPTGEDINNSHIKVIITDKKTKNNQKLNLKKINSPIKGYMTEKEYAEKIKEYVTNGRKLTKRSSIYGENLYLEVERYAQNSLDTALSTEFDIIHAHDWLTYKAGIIAKKATGKPLIVHIHATEFDRCGGEGINQKIYEIEKEGFNEANKILSVSQLTKKRLIKSYGINPNKIEVVHNAVEFNEESFKKENRKSKLNEKYFSLLLNPTI